MCGDPPAGEVHGNWTPIEREMDISNHWHRAGNDGNRRDQGVYRPSQKHGFTIHCDSYYHGLVSGGGAESGDVALAEMVGAVRSIYTRDKNITCSIWDTGRDGDRWFGGREILGYRRV